MQAGRLDRPALPTGQLGRQTDRRRLKVSGDVFGGRKLRPDGSWVDVPQPSDPQANGWVPQVELFDGNVCGIEVMGGMPRTTCVAPDGATAR